jgi:hypothetical protein
MKKLYIINAKVLLSDDTILDADLVAFADDPEAAKSSVANWVITENPWNRSADDPRKAKDCRGSSVEEIGSFRGYGDGDGPIKWKLVPLYQMSPSKPFDS